MLIKCEEIFVWSEYGSFKILTVMCLGALFELYKTSVGARGKNNNAIIILRRRNWEEKRNACFLHYYVSLDSSS